MELKPLNEGETLDEMRGDTLFKLSYRGVSRTYRVDSYTPVEGYPKPLHVGTVIRREEAEAHKERNFFTESFSTDTAAFDLGVTRLEAEIPCAMRKLREEELVAGELEAIEGFGSF